MVLNEKEPGKPFGTARLSPIITGFLLGDTLLRIFATA